jgi:hypothetical protein
MFRRDAGQNSVVNSRVNFGAKVVHKAVERAEGWQVYRRRLQCLDRPIDEVCGVAHGFGGPRVVPVTNSSAASPYGVTERRDLTFAW